MMHPDTRLVFVSEAQGLGVVATAFLPMGTILWVRDPWDIVVHAPPPDLREMVERFAYTEADGVTLIPWDHGRNVNHSCRPNAVGLLAGVDLAVRDIHPGEQITNDYGTLGTFERFPCACGDAACRGEVAPRESVDAGLVAQFEAARVLVDAVPQPLGKRARKWLAAERPALSRTVPGNLPRVSGRLSIR